MIYTVKKEESERASPLSERVPYRESRREKRAERLIWETRGDHSQKCGRQGAKGTHRFSNHDSFARSKG
jgi:hypothetical protein